VEETLAAGPRIDETEDRHRQVVDAPTKRTMTGAWQWVVASIRRYVAAARPHAAAIVFAALVVAVCRYNQHGGHDWGDDFSLYIRQAKAIAEGSVNKVISQNKFSLAASSWHSFSPSIYPWGFPLMLAPLFAIGGINYGLFKLLEAVLLGGFLLLLYALLNKRIGRLGGLAVMATIGLSVAYVGWTDTVLSDIPYLFMAYLSLWLLDRVRRDRLLAGHRIGPLIGVGIAAGYAFSTRREGLALLAAMLASAAAYVIGCWTTRDRDRPFKINWLRLAVPALSFVGFVLAMNIVLPSPILEHVAGTGLGQLRANLQAYGFSLAEQIGLKDPGRSVAGRSLWGFAGSPGTAKLLFALFLAAAAIGIVVRLVTAFAEDTAIVAFLVFTTLIIGIAPFRDSRYIFSLTPLLVYFAFQGVAAGPTFIGRVVPQAGLIGRRLALPLAVAFVTLLAIGNGTDTWHKTKFRHDFGSYTIDGVGQPAWQELFAEVRTDTKPTDVIAFFRARTMVLYTDRDSIQSTNIYGVIGAADYYARRKDASNYSQAPLDDQSASDLGFTLVWENVEFELWQVPKI
jgi:hypothetical protein